MTQFIGVDFGTTNVRLATWDPEEDRPPRSILIGAQNTPAMPAVIALELQPDGDIAKLIGEEADELQDEENRRLVIRNIKRFALSGDSYVQWHLDVRNAHEESPKWPPSWWNPESDCVQVWGRDFPVWDLIGDILYEAFWRADIQGDYEWRTGCPVHSDFEYRRDLAKCLSQVTGRTGHSNHVIEEPILFLTAARRLGDLPAGAFLVYDLGGGSFDCALAELGSQDEMVMYGAEGHPLLGGTDIDDALTTSLRYTGQPNLLRQAKESLDHTNPAVTLQDGTVLTLEDVKCVLKNRKFADKSAMVLRDAYIGAKTCWKRSSGEDDPPVGDILHRNHDTGGTRFIWQLKWDDLASDVDGIILFGGPTRDQFFRDYLGKLFGPDKIVVAEDLLSGVEAAAITGASIGACYVAGDDSMSQGGGFTPLYINRLPVRITLEDLHTGQRIDCEPFRHLVSSPRRPFDDFVSEEFLAKSPEDPHSNERYQLTIASPGNSTRGRSRSETLLPARGSDGVLRELHSVDPHINARLTGATLRLVIDRLGRVWVEQWSEKQGSVTYLILEDTPWQTGLQKEKTESLFRADRDYRESHGFEPSNWREGLKTRGRAP